MSKFTTVGAEIERDGFSYYTTAQFHVRSNGEAEWAELIDIEVDDAPEGGIELTDAELERLEEKALAA